MISVISKIKVLKSATEIGKRDNNGHIPTNAPTQRHDTYLLRSGNCVAYSSFLELEFVVDEAQHMHLIQQAGVITPGVITPRPLLAYGPPGERHPCLFLGLSL
jgi:hypothetical protein